jgi:hypothetical protein
MKFRPGMLVRLKRGTSQQIKLYGRPFIVLEVGTSNISGGYLTWVWDGVENIEKVFYGYDLEEMKNE